MSAEIYVATDSAVLFAAGQQFVVHRNSTRVRAGHPVLARNAHLFKPLDVDYDVEQTTATPGEKRSVAKTLDLAAVRAWAKDNDIDVPSRGRVPDSVIEQYQAVQGG